MSRGGVVPVAERTYGTSAPSGGKCFCSSNGLGDLGLAASGSAAAPSAGAAPSAAAAASAGFASSFGAGGGVGSFGGGGGVLGFGRRSVQMGSTPGMRSTKAKSRSSPISAKRIFSMISSSDVGAAMSVIWRSGGYV